MDEQCVFMSAQQDEPLPVRFAAVAPKLKASGSFLAAQVVLAASGCLGGDFLKDNLIAPTKLNLPQTVLYQRIIISCSPDNFVQYSHILPPISATIVEEISISLDSSERLELEVRSEEAMLHIDGNLVQTEFELSNHDLLVGYEGVKKSVDTLHFSGPAPKFMANKPRRSIVADLQLAAGFHAIRRISPVQLCVVTDAKDASNWLWLPVIGGESEIQKMEVVVMYAANAEHFSVPILETNSAHVSALPGDDLKRDGFISGKIRVDRNQSLLSERVQPRSE